MRRRHGAILWATPLVVIAAALLGLPAFGEFGTDGDFDDGAAEAVRAGDALTRATGASVTPNVIVLVAGATPARLARVRAALRAPGVARVGTPVRSSKTRGALVTATYAVPAPAGTDPTAVIAERLDGVPWAGLGGGAFVADQVSDQLAHDIFQAEVIALPLVLLLSLYVFRGLVAALLPLVVGLVTVVVSVALLRLVDHQVTGLSVYALNLVNALGFGLAIDYSLFMVSRFREELARGVSSEAALRATVRHAGHTVAFSAATVAAALAALLVFPQRFLYSMGIAGVICALTAAAVSFTVLAALLGVLGPRVNALSPVRWQRAIAHDANLARSGPWYRHSRRVMRRPVTVALLAGGVLVLLGLPFAQLNFTGVDATVLPHERSARVVDDAVARDFGGGPVQTVYAWVPGTDRAAARAYAAQLEAVPGVTGAVLSPPLRGGSRIDVYSRSRILTPGAQQIVRAVRAVPAPPGTLAGGWTAAFLDQQASLAGHLPLALVLLAAATLAILFAMTRSVVLPVKALLMNLLTLSAMFGVLVLVFQHGWLSGLLGFTSQGGIESSQPVLLFAIGFGLSTDYGVFLLGRIKELHDAGVPNEEAVALGLQRTGRIVSYAALLFLVAVGAFVTSDIIFMKQLALGTALAVAIDATLVRALLVPALMRLLGDRNWWRPRLRRRAAVS